MDTDGKKELQLEIAHVLFIDIVGYSKMLINEQHDSLQELNQIVRDTETFRSAEAAGKLIRLPTGDGMALAFSTTPDAPVQCALEIGKALKSRPEIPVRMGVHSGPVSGIVDVNDRSNVAGAGINMAQRIMDCGDAGHILLSKRVAEDLAQYRQWKAQLHDLGECQVKHSVAVSVVNLYTDEVGNPQVPEKFKRPATEPLPATPPPSPRRNNYSLGIALLVLLVALTAGWWIYSRRSTPAPIAAVLPNKSSDSADPKGIAVLPFENFSEDKANAYFADGIQDEILTRLASIAELKVISRISTQRYKSAPDNLPEIAKQLGVANILEGSVQKSGDTVRVNVQLISAAKDSHLWAETFDRKLTDIFAVESEIAERIAAVLQTKLTGKEKESVRARPTDNPAAYDAYLRGQALVDSYRDSRARLDQIADYFTQAVQLDPNFALAWARLSVVHSRVFWLGFDRSAKRRDDAKETMARALALIPDLTEARLAQGYYQYWIMRDYDAALATFRDAQQRLPNNAEVVAAIGNLERRKGHYEESLIFHLKAAELSPRDVSLIAQPAVTYEIMREFSKAHQLTDRMLNVDPASVSVLSLQARLFLAEGKLDEARKTIASAPSTPDRPYYILARAKIAFAAGQYAEAVTFLQEAIAQAGASLGYHAAEYRYLLGYARERAGDKAGARADHEQARAELEKFAATQPDSPEVPMLLAFVHAELGEKDKALQFAADAIKIFPTAKFVSGGPAYEEALARVQARVGETDAALGGVERLLTVPYLGPEEFVLTSELLRLDPVWDPLRNDPRFAQILAGPPATK